MTPATFNTSSPSSSPSRSPSRSPSHTEWADRPRSRDSASGPRRSLLSSHFSQEEGKEEEGSGRKVWGKGKEEEREVWGKGKEEEGNERTVRGEILLHFSQEVEGEGRKVRGWNGGRAQPSRSELSKSLPSPPRSAFLDQEEEEALEPRTPPDVTTSYPPLTPMAPRKSYKCRVAPLGKQQPRRLQFGEGSPESHIQDDLQPQTPPDQSFNSFAPVSTSKKPSGTSITYVRELR